MTAEVSIVVVPRERFSYARDALEALYRHTEPPFELVYVDAGSPSGLRACLEEQAASRGFALVRAGRFLTPNEARNLGFARVRTRYTVFLDNDVAVSAGWLPPLLRCAEETGAAVVGPLYCIDEPLHRRVHMAGGLARFEERDGRRRFVEKHLHIWRPIEEVRPQVARSRCEHQEFHCMLVRSEVLRALGPLDESLLSVTETQLDFCLQVRAAGHEVWFEPASVVTYVRPPPFEPSDLAYWLWRWDDERARLGLERFRVKWGLERDDPYPEVRRRWIAEHRQRLTR